MRQSMNTARTAMEGRSTVELLASAQLGDAAARMSLVTRAVPRLKSWLRGRLPDGARGHQDTGDLVQDAVLQMLGHVKRFNPQHAGAVPAYLRRTAMNRLRDEARKVTRRPHVVELDEQLPSEQPNPLVHAIRQENSVRVRRALRELRAKDRRVIACATGDCTLAEIAKMMGLGSAAAAGMALCRAKRKLKAQLAV